MVRKTKKSLNHLLWVKIRREIRANFKQFFALILIAGLAVTLYVGLSSNAKNLRQRVDKLYEDGNIADIFVYVSRDDDASFQALSEIEGVAKVEKRLILDQCLIYQNTGTLLVQEAENEICVPASLEGERGAVLDSMFASLNQIEIGQSIRVELPYSVEDFIGDTSFGRLLIDYSDSFLKDGVSVNPLRSDLSFQVEVTGVMTHPETVEREFAHGTCLMDTNVFEALYRQMFLDAFIPTVAESFYQQLKGLSLINQFLIQVSDGYDADEVNEAVYRYFNPSAAHDDSFTVNSQFWGTYLSGDGAYEMTVSGEKVVINGETYKIVSHTSDVFQLLRLGGTESAILMFNDGEVYLNIDDTSLLFHLSEETVFVTSLTVDLLPSNATMEQDIYQAKQLCVVFPTIFFIVAALVIMTSLSQTISRSRQEIGTMKALGISSWKILFHYIGMGIVLTMIGSVIGAIAGPLIIPNVLNVKYSILYNLPSVGVIYPWGSIALCIGIFMLLASVVTVGVTFSEIRLKPVESMRTKPMKAFKRLPRTKAKRSTLALSLTMAFRNIFAKKTRMLMVIFGVMGCTSLTVAGFGIIDTINYGLSLDLYETYQADISLNYNNVGQPYEILSSYDEIDTIQEFTSKVLRVQSDRGSLDTYLNVYSETAGKNAYSFLGEIQGGIALAASVASSLGVKQGDELTLIYLSQAYTATVDVVFEASYWLSLYTLEGNFPELGFTPTGANLILKEHDSADAFAARLSEETDFDDVTSVNGFQAQIDDTLSSVKLMCNTVKIFAILLAIVVTYNLASLNFTERKRDISTLKVLGFSTAEIGLSLVFELMLLTLIGAGFGLLLGRPLLYLIMSINETKLLHYIYHINALSYLISVAISLGTAVIVNSYSAFLAGKVDAVSALKSVE